MTVSRLTLTDFRNYPDARIVPGAGINVLTGDNGAGKTNILEALSLLAPGRGLRGAALSEMARTGGNGSFAIVADVGSSRIGVGTQQTAPERRIVRIDGTAGSATSLAERVALIWVTPQMDRLFADSAGDRRRFLDRLVLAIDPGHAGETARYDAAMRQRNRLLAADAPPDPAWLDALEHQMEVHGHAVMAARIRLIDAVTEQMAGHETGPFARAALSINGWQPHPGFAQRLSRMRSADAAARRTGEGPHRADLMVTHVDKQQPAARCSTGEQKALLLSIVLAHARLVAARRGTPPVLLLDEVAAHLDATRRAALLGRIADLGGQAWLTGTDAALFTEAPQHSLRFYINTGEIRSD